jgi:hypothetical protein
MPFAALACYARFFGGNLKNGLQRGQSYLKHNVVLSEQGIFMIAPCEMRSIIDLKGHYQN